MAVIDTKGKLWMQTQTAECPIFGEFNCDKMMIVLNQVNLFSPETHTTSVILGNFQCSAVDQVEVDVFANKSSLELELLALKLTQMEAKVKTASAKEQENSGEKVLQEVGERALQKQNIVMHRCPELTGGDSGRRTTMKLGLFS